MNNWWVIDEDGDKSYEIQSIKDFPKNVIGFIYCLKDKISGKWYVGRKVLYFNIRRKIGKKEKLLMSGKGRKPNHEKIKKESDWFNYLGSCEYFKDLKNQGKEDIIKREIIQFCYSKKHLTYSELKWLFNLNVLEDPLSVNENIQGRFFRKDLLF